MVKKSSSLQALSPGQRAEKADRIMPKSPEIVKLLAEVEDLLQAGEPKKALDLIRRSKIQSPWITNAMGVCQLRLGSAKLAVDIYRGLLLAAGGLHMRDDMPAVFKTNYAVALLEAGNMAGCLSVLADVGQDHPAAEKLRTAIDRYKKGLTLWERINWYLGVHPDRTVALDFPPGSLE